MPQFIKKPVEVAAIQYQWDETTSIDEIQDQIADFIGKNIGLAGDLILIDGVHGEVTAKPGDWIIKQNDQDFYPCSDEVFQKNYAPMQQTTWLERVKQEKANMQSMLDALEMTLRTESKPDAIAQDQWDLMHRQQFHMRQYVQILEERINKAKVQS